jgi:hypothetical protein
MDEQHARQQIQDALLSYCRGIDRLDGDALLRAFHPGAMLVDFGADPMTIETFATHALASLGKRFSATQHRISNTAIDFDDSDGGDGGSGAGDGGSGALVETYVLAYHIERPSDGADGADDADDAAVWLHTFNGRYIDRFEEREGTWRISTRTLRNDWSKIETIDESMSGTWQASGRAGSTDPLYDTR